MRTVTRKFPARRLTSDEQALVAEWLASAGDVASAYVSQRRSDDPDLHHRVLVDAGSYGAPSHIVYAALGRDIWVVLKSGRRTKIQRFRTLRAALNSIRPVLVEPGEVGIVSTLGWMAIIATAMSVGALANSEKVYAEKIHAELSLLYSYIDTLP